MAILTDQIKAANVELNDLVHIARPYNPEGYNQSDNGSSYKATISQLIDANGCCLESGTFTPSLGTIDFYGISGDLSFTINNVFPFTGGSSNCIDNLYVINVHPCVENINFHPNSITGRNTFIGEYTGYYGFSIFHTDVNDDFGSNFKITKLGLNLNTVRNAATFQFNSYNRLGEFMLYDNLGPIANLFVDVQEVITVSNSLTLSHSFTVKTSDGCSLMMGAINLSDNSNGKFGTPSEGFLSTSGNSLGLNIVSTDVTTNNSGYIRFFLGCDYESCNFEPHIHIDGDHPTKGFMGVGRNNINPTSLLDINGTNSNNITRGYQQLRLRTSYTPPNDLDFGVGAIPEGTICWDNTGIYIKVLPVIWRKFPMFAW